MSTPTSSNDYSSDSDYGVYTVNVYDEAIAQGQKSNNNFETEKNVCSDVPISHENFMSDNVLKSEIIDSNIENQSDSVHNITSIKEFKTEITVENVHRVKFLIDSGSSVNIITLETFNKINKTNKGRLKLQKTKSKVLTYGEKQPSLKILGTVDLTLETNKKISSARFDVIDAESSNLLTGSIAIDLGLLIIHPTRNKNQT